MSYRYQMEKEEIVFNIVGYFFISLFALICLIPFILVISGSLSDETSIIREGYRFIPKKVSLEAYRLLFRSPEQIASSYAVTIMVTLVGTSLSVFITGITAYVLSRKNFIYRNQVAFLIYFTQIFSGGLIPFYLLIVKYLELKNTIWALIFPELLMVWNLILLRTFMLSIPGAIIESAKIDGASELTICLRIIFPLSLPGMATIGLFQALYYWNDWFMAKLFITDNALFPLQYYLFETINNFMAMDMTAANAGIPLPEMPKESFKMAMVIVASGPIVLLYPFVQKYFVKGLTVGSVKG